MGTAEVQASIMASLWILQSPYRNFTLCYDAQYVETIASAMAQPKTNVRYANLAFALRHPVHTDNEQVFSMHIKPHRNEPWNEMADVVCDQSPRRDVGFAMVPFPTTTNMP